MGGKASRTKGHSYERYIAQRMREVMPSAAEQIKRGFQTRGGGAEEADVECPFFHVETKKGKKPNPRAALKQATEDATKSGRGNVPVAIIGDDRQPAFVVMSLEDWLDLVKEWWHMGELLK